MNYINQLNVGDTAIASKTSGNKHSDKFMFKHINKAKRKQIEFEITYKKYNLDEQDIIGVLKKQNKANIFKPKNDIEKNYWFTLNRDDVFSYTGKNFSEYIIYLDGNYQTPKPKKIDANISNNHKKYALTWFSLAISILLLYLYFRKKNY